jgi:hypothetical protein
MEKKRNTRVTRRGDGYDKWAFDQTPDQWGEKLERFFEENEVGMDGVIHWKDAAVEEINPYNLMVWFDIDSVRLGIWSTAEESSTLDTFSYGKTVPFQYLLRSVYQGRGTFRYEEPGEELFSDTEMKLVFSNLTNLGVAGRLQF